jgi:hypothetical protein
MRPRTKTIVLALLGTGLVGCDPHTESLIQQTYRSLDDCRRDWGNDADACRPQSHGAGAGGTGGAGGRGPSYVGPRFYYDRQAGYPIVINDDGSTRPMPNSALRNTHGVSSVAHSTVISETTIRGGFGGGEGGAGEGGGGHGGGEGGGGGHGGGGGGD